jgi:arsenate reductase
MNEVTIYHNPNCGTSRNVLGLIRNAGIEPTIIEYLKAPPDRQTLLGLIERMGIGVRELLRRKGTPYDELRLDDPSGRTISSLMPCWLIQFSSIVR